jgi:translation elongation factor P/translation initiation factor 5A
MIGSQPARSRGAAFQYLYQDGGGNMFMNAENLDQVHSPADIVGDMAREHDREDLAAQRRADLRTSCCSG